MQGDLRWLCLSYISTLVGPIIGKSVGATNSFSNELDANTDQLHFRAAAPRRECKYLK